LLWLLPVIAKSRREQAALSEVRRGQDATMRVVIFVQPGFERHLRANAGQFVHGLAGRLSMDAPSIGLNKSSINDQQDAMSTNNGSDQCPRAIGTHTLASIENHVKIVSQ
jgi:hypothetical protein